MSLRTRHIATILSVLLGLSSYAVAGTTGTATISGSEQVTGGIWDFGTVTVTVNNYSESVPYGQYSTPDSLAGAIAAKFSNDCNGPANARSAPGGVINFRMRNSVELTQLSVSVSSGLSFSGNPAAPMSPTATTASIGATVVASGQSTTVNVQVSCNQACGQVTYQIDGWPWTTGTLDGSGHVSTSTPGNLTAGLHNVVAVYQGNGVLAPSTSNAVSFIVSDSAGAASTTTISSIGATVVAPGQSTTVDVQVSCNQACGQVAYQIDGGPWITGTLDGSGHTSASTPTNLAAGLHNVTAAYQGNGSFTASTSNPVSFMVSASAGSPPTSVYSYNISSYAPNGNISAYTDTVNGSWSNIGYDGLNRLTSATYAAAAGTQYMCWGYDSFGNRTYQGTFTSPCSGPPPNIVNYDAGNHVIGIGYNASGDVINDGTSQYLYDAEGRVCAVKNNNSGAQVGYIYNAEGQRVAKGTITAFSCDTSSNGFTQTAGYVIGPDGEQVSEGDAAGNWVHTNVYAAGHLIATYENDGLGVHFHLSDWLGTRRVQTDYAGNLESTYETLPYGELIPANQSLGATEHLFTGKERDTESGLDYFGARYYASSMGRFMSPDWSAKAEPVPYSKLDNPQSLNLYAYVGNNPLSRTDPTGHADILAECKGQSTCNKTLVQTVNIVHQDKKGNTVIDSTLKVTTKFSLTTDAKGNVTASASSTVANVSGHQFSDKQLATMGTDIGTMQQAAVTMGFGPNTTQLVTAVGAAESHFGTSPPYAGAPAYMNPAINPMQLIGKNGANLDLNHNVDGGMDVLDWAGRPSTFDPTATYSRYSDHSPTTMSNWDAIYGSINEQQP